jgi:hypothetical protein
VGAHARPDQSFSAVSPSVCGRAAHLINADGDSVAPGTDPGLLLQRSYSVHIYSTMGIKSRCNIYSTMGATYGQALPDHVHGGRRTSDSVHTRLNETSRANGRIGRTPVGDGRNKRLI